MRFAAARDAVKQMCAAAAEICRNFFKRLLLFGVEHAGCGVRAAFLVFERVARGFFFKKLRHAVFFKRFKHRNGNACHIDNVLDARIPVFEKIIENGKPFLNVRCFFGAFAAGVIGCAGQHAHKARNAVRDGLFLFESFRQFAFLYQAQDFCVVFFAEAFGKVFA